MAFTHVYQPIGLNEPVMFGPNITGYFSNNGDGRFENSSGSFTNNTSVTRSHSGNNANEGRGFDFSASKSSSFYGQSSTVKPPAMSALVLIKF